MAATPEIAQAVTDTLARITAAWREGRPRAMAPLLDERFAMALPGFAGHVEGREALIESFEAFGREARVHELRQGPVRVDGARGAAVAQCPFEMVYERDGGVWRATGWDVWVFARSGDEWIAVWRTMEGIAEEPASRSAAERPALGEHSSEPE
jgi:hypothetical protein